MSPIAWDLLQLDQVVMTAVMQELRCSTNERTSIGCIKSDVEHDELQNRRPISKRVATLSSRFDEKVEELSFVRMVSDALARCTTAENICKAIVRLIQETLAPENCSVFTVEEREILLRAAMGAFDDEPAYFEAAFSPCSFSIGQGLIGHSVEAGRTLRLSTADDQGLKTVRTEPSRHLRFWWCH